MRIVVAIAWLHLTWALLLIVAPQSQGATALSILVYAFRGRALTILVLVLVAGAALWGNRIRGLPGFFLLLPQQFFVLVSLGGAIVAVLAGQFADGTVRPWGFIAADQSWTLLVAVLHSWALLAHRWK